MNFNYEIPQFYSSSKILEHSNLRSNIESRDELIGDNDNINQDQNMILNSKNNSNKTNSNNRSHNDNDVNNNFLSLYPKQNANFKTSLIKNNEDYDKIVPNRKKLKNTFVPFHNPIRISAKNLMNQIQHYKNRKTNIGRHKLSLGDEIKRNSYQINLYDSAPKKKNLKQIQRDLKNKLLDMSLQIENEENEDNSLSEERSIILSNIKNGINQEIKSIRKEIKRNTYHQQKKNNIHFIHGGSFKKYQTGYIKDMNNNINNNTQKKELVNEEAKKEKEKNQKPKHLLLSRRKSFIPQTTLNKLNKLENQDIKNRLNSSVNMNLYRDLIPNINMNMTKEELSTINNKSMLISKKNINIKKILLNSIKNEQFENKYRLLLRQKELYDSFEDEEVIEELEDEYFFINPETYQIFIFDSLILIGTLFGSFYFPIYIAQSNCFCSYIPKAIEYILFFLDVINILDIIISFFRAYYNFEYTLIKNNARIIIHYIKKYLFCDLLSAIPIFSISYYFCNRYEYKPDGNICFYNGIDLNYNFMKMALGLKLIKLLKVMDKKANRGINYFYEVISESYTLEKVMGMLLFLMECVIGFNFFICYHIYIGLQSYPNWILKTNNQDESFGNLYVTSLYFLITTITSVGYGDITCVSLSETLYQIIILTIGVIAYSWIVSTIGNYVKKETRAAIKFNKDISILEEIRVSYPKMGFKLYNKIHKHLETVSHQQEKLDSNLLVTNLPYTLKNQIMFIIYGSIIKKFKFFKECENSDFILRALTSFIPLSTKKGAFIIQEGEIVDNIVFVREGRLSLVASIDLDNPLSSIESYLGEKFEDINEKMNTDLNNSLMDKSINNIALKFDKAKTVLKTVLKTKEEIEEENIGQEMAKKDFEGEDLEIGNVQILNILDILKNEHYGIVYMFLKKPSPLSLRVKSKYSQLFLLRKNDTMQISKAYPNVWKKIYYKSYHNMKSIKKLTQKIIINYCKHYGHKLENSRDASFRKGDDSNNNFLMELGILNSRKKKRPRKIGFNLDGNNIGNKAMTTQKSILKNKINNENLRMSEKSLYPYKSFKMDEKKANNKLFGTQMNNTICLSQNKANTNINKNIPLFSSRNKLSSAYDESPKGKINQINQINKNINYNIVINGVNNKNDDYSKTLVIKSEENKKMKSTNRNSYINNNLNSNLSDKRVLNYMQHIPSRIKKENSLPTSIFINNKNIFKNSLLFNNNNSNQDKGSNQSIANIVTLKARNSNINILRANTIQLNNSMEKSEEKSPNTINNLSKSLLKKVKKKIKKQRKKKKMYKMLIQKINESLMKVNPNFNFGTNINNSIILSSKMGDFQIPIDEQFHAIIDEKQELSQEQYPIAMPMPNPYELLMIPETLEIPSSDESSEDSDNSSNGEKKEESIDNNQKNYLINEKKVDEKKDKKINNFIISQNINFSFNSTYENLNKISENNYAKDENLQKSVIKLIKVYLNEKTKLETEKNRLNESNSNENNSNDKTPKNKDNNNKDMINKQKIMKKEEQKEEKEKDVWSFLDNNDNSPKNIRHGKTNNIFGKKKKKKSYSDLFSLVETSSPKSIKKSNISIKKKKRKSIGKSVSRKEISKKKSKHRNSYKPILNLHTLEQEEEEENEDDKKENKEVNKEDDKEENKEDNKDNDNDDIINSLEFTDLDENERKESYLKKYYKTYQKKRKKQDEEKSMNDNNK